MPSEPLLLPCPWCDKPPEVCKAAGYGFTVECVNETCAVAPALNVTRGRANAIKSWNTRATNGAVISATPTVRHQYRDRWCEQCQVTHRYFTRWAPESSAVNGGDIPHDPTCVLIAKSYEHGMACNCSRRRKVSTVAASEPVSGAYPAGDVYAATSDFFGEGLPSEPAKCPNCDYEMELQNVCENCGHRQQVERS